MRSDSRREDDPQEVPFPSGWAARRCPPGSRRRSGCWVRGCARGRRWPQLSGASPRSCAARSHVDDRHDARRPLPVKGGQQEPPGWRVGLAGAVQIAGLLHRQHRGRAAISPKERVVGLLAHGDGPAQHPPAAGFDYDAPVPGERHHAVGHMEEKGAPACCACSPPPDGVAQLPGHVVEGACQNANLIPGGHLNLVGEISPATCFRAGGEPPGWGWIMSWRGEGEY